MKKKLVTFVTIGLTAVVFLWVYRQVQARVPALPAV